MATKNEDNSGKMPDNIHVHKMRPRSYSETPQFVNSDYGYQVCLNDFCRLTAHCLFEGETIQITRIYEQPNGIDRDFQPRNELRVEGKVVGTVPQQMVYDVHPHNLEFIFRGGPVRSEDTRHDQGRDKDALYIGVLPPKKTEAQEPEKVSERVSEFIKRNEQPNYRGEPELPMWNGDTLKVVTSMNAGSEVEIDNPWIYAFGMLTRLKPDMLIRCDDPVGMAKEIYEYMASTEQRRYGEAKNDTRIGKTLRESLDNFKADKAKESDVTTVSKIVEHEGEYFVIPFTFRKPVGHSGPEVNIFHNLTKDQVKRNTKLMIEAFAKRPIHTRTHIHISSFGEPVISVSGLPGTLVRIHTKKSSKYNGKEGYVYTATNPENVIVRFRDKTKQSFNIKNVFKIHKFSSDKID